MEKKLNNILNNRSQKVNRQPGSSTTLPSDDSLFYYDCLEIEHLKSMPNFTNRYLIETFPEAKTLIKEKLQREIDQAEADIKEANRLAPIYEYIIYCKASRQSEQFWRDVVDVIFLDPLTVKQAETIKKNTLLLSMLSGKSSTKNPIGVTQEEIAHAKEYPISDLIDFSHNQAKCIFHTERTGSMHYYQKTNTVYCFGCHVSADPIDVYRYLNHCSFIEAVRRLQ